MCFLMSAAVRASTSSKSSDAFTSSPICVSVASTSSDTSEGVEVRMGSVCASGGFIAQMTLYQATATARGQTIPHQATEGFLLAEDFYIVPHNLSQIPLQIHWGSRIQRS